eukprot:6347774-Heterocapsa_arctica.AAC.1
MTLRPWASNLNAARCPHCCEMDHHTICMVGMTCRHCGQILQRAQEDLSIYDQAIDDAARKRTSDRSSLYKAGPDGTPASKPPNRSKSQEPGNFGPDTKSSEKAQVNKMVEDAKAAKLAPATGVSGPYGTEDDQDPNAAHGSGWKPVAKGAS